MFMPDLHLRLLEDLRAIGITEEFNLELKTFSKTFLGRYNPNTRTLRLYVFQDQKHMHPYPYTLLLTTAIHEAIHCIQWSNPNYVRRKGVMHNAEFHYLYDKYVRKSRDLLKEREKSDEIFHSKESVHSKTEG